MPLTSKGEEIKGAMEKEYGKEKGESVFYASANKGTIKGVHDAVTALADAVSGLSTRIDAFEQRRADVLDPKYLEWIEALKKANKAKAAYEKASREADPKRHALKEKYDKLDTEQRRLSDLGWITSSTPVIGGRP